MLRCRFFLSFLTFSLSAAAQTDTLNQVDSAGNKQGWWKVTGAMKKQNGFPPDSVYEEGRYVDSKKDGVWIEYFPNGNVNKKLTWKNNRPNGAAQLFYENGQLKEEGCWKGARWVGAYLQYEQNGDTLQFFNYSQIGKREGRQRYYRKGKVYIDAMFRDGKEHGEVREYFEDGGILVKQFENGYLVSQKTIETSPAKKDSIRPRPPVPPKEKPKPFTGDGYFITYNKNKQISEKGIFAKGKLKDGQHYVYDKDGILVRIQLYKDFKYAGDAPLEKTEGK